MTREEVRNELITAICDIQKLSGRTLPVIHDDICPIGSLEGFDSLNAMEVTAILSTKLSIDVNIKVFECESENRSLSIREIVDRILAQNQGG